MDAPDPQQVAAHIAPVIARWLGNPFRTMWLGLRDGKATALALTFCDELYATLRFGEPVQASDSGLAGVRSTALTVEFATERTHTHYPSVLSALNDIPSWPRPSLSVADRLCESHGLPWSFVAPHLPFNKKHLTYHAVRGIEGLRTLLLGDKGDQLISRLPPDAVAPLADIVLAHPDYFGRYLDALEQRKLAPLWRLLSWQPRVEPIDLFGEIRERAGRADAAATLKALPAQAVARLIRLGGGDPAPRLRYYHHLIASLKRYRRDIADSAAPEYTIAYVGELCQRLAALDVLPDDGAITGASMMALSLNRDRRIAAPQLAATGECHAETFETQVTVRALRAVFRKALAHFAGRSLDPHDLDEAARQLDLILYWVRSQSDEEAIARVCAKDAPFRRLARQARAHAEEGLRDVKWACPVERDGFAFPGWKIRPLTSERMLLHAGHRYLNCLRDTDERTGYAIGAYCGEHRLFSLERHDDRDRAILWLAREAGRWQVSQVLGTCNADCSGEATQFAERVAAHYNDVAADLPRRSIADLSLES